MKKLFFNLFLIFGVSVFYGQETEDLLSDEDEIIDNLLGEETLNELLKSTANFHFLNFSIDYNNKTYFSGRDIGTDQFNISPQLTYINSKGFFLGLTGVYYDKFTPKWDYTSVNVGYGKSFGAEKKLRWSVTYARYFYTNTSQENPFKNTISLGLDIDNKKKTLGAEIAVAYLFGDDNSLQITGSTYGVLSLFKAKKNHLKLRPELSITIAEQTIQLSRTFTFRGRQFTRYFNNNDFGLLNTSLNIPLQYDVGNFDFELGYIINFPSPLKGETNLETTNFFNLSLSYLFDL